MSRLLMLYGTQFRILREWRGGPGALVKRLVIVVVVAAVSLLLTSWLLPTFTVATFRAAVAMVIVMALINALVRPVVLAFIAPRSLILTGVLVLLLQILVFLVSANFVGGVDVSGIFTGALLASFVYAIFNTVLTAILGVDSGDSFYGTARPAAAPQARRAAVGPAGPRHRPDRRARPPDPRGADPGRLGQHDGALGARAARTRSRSGRRSCRR